MDVEKNWPNLIVSKKLKELSYHIGGDFDPHFQVWYKLKVIEPSSNIRYIFSLPITDALIQEDGPQFYRLNIYTGYFKYDPSLEYLSTTNQKKVAFNNMEDLVRASNLHKSIYLGDLPVSIRNK